MCSRFAYKSWSIFEYAVKQTDIRIAGEFAILQHKITNEVEVGIQKDES